MNRVWPCILGVLALGGLAAGPPPLSPDRIDEMRRLQQAARHSDYAWRQVEFLSNHIGPRLTGSPQAQAAVAYVSTELSRLGLKVHTEPCMVPHWVRGEERAELEAWPGQPSGVPPQKVVLTALGGSSATPAAGLTAPVVVVDSFAALEKLPDDAVRGHIILYNVVFDKALAARGYGLDAYEDKVGYRWDGANVGARKGAVAVLVRSVGGAEFRLPHTGSMGYDEGVSKIPAAAVCVEDAEKIADLAKDGVVRMHLVLTPQTLPDVPSADVVADLPGRTDEIVLVSGHLDSWDLGTGAIDDGAGVAIAMEAGHLISELHVQPQRTIRVVAWMNEENGGRGAKSYAAAHQADRHYAAIESDLGAGAPNGFLAHVDAAHFDALEPLHDMLSEAGAPAMEPVFDSPGADISPLDKAGVPTFGVIQDGRYYFDYHHTAADTLDKIVPAELQQNCAAVTTLVWGLANMEGSLR